MPSDIIGTRFQEHAALVQATLAHLEAKVRRAADMMVETYRAGHGVFAFGNGGSAADAQHLVGELVGRFLKERKALRAEALSVNTSVLTALANDYSLELVFARQLEANAAPGDLAIGLSTSGNSPNVVAALKHCRSRGIRTIAMTGQGGGRCAEHADLLLDIPSRETPRVQEAGMLIYHVICEKVEAELAE